MNAAMEGIAETQPKLPRPFLELSSCFTDLSHLAAAESAREAVAASTFRAVAQLLRSTSEEEDAKDVENVKDSMDCLRRPPRFMAGITGICVEPRAIAAKLTGLRLQELSGASAEGKASWMALVQRELEKDACPEARREEVIACLRPPRPKAMRQERRIEAPLQEARTMGNTSMPAPMLGPSPAPLEPREARSPETDCHWSLDGSRPMTAACADSEASTRCATAEKATVVTKVEMQLPPVPQDAKRKKGRSKSDSKSMDVPIRMLSAIYSSQHRRRFKFAIA